MYTQRIFHETPLVNFLPSKVLPKFELLNSGSSLSTSTPYPLVFTVTYLNKMDSKNAFSMFKV